MPAAFATGKVLRHRGASCHHSPRADCREHGSSYLKRRQGRAEVIYHHPSLEPVLRRTLGVPLFQDNS